MKSLKEAVPELRRIARLTVTIPFNKDSADVGPADWLRLAKRIHRDRGRFGGFVVVHGTDTMSFTAAALSFCLAGLSLPIVLTGSQRPLHEVRSDARQNLIDAVGCATSGKLREVAICFGSRLLRGNRARKLSTSRYDAFASWGYPDLARMGLFVEWNDGALLPAQDEYLPTFDLETKVVRIAVVPGSKPSLFERLRPKGVLLEGFGTGNVPGEGWVAAIERWRKNGVLVVLASQCVEGPVDPSLYRTGQRALDAGALSAGRMIPEAALVKMMVCIAGGRDFEQEIAGEAQ